MKKIWLLVIPFVIIGMIQGQRMINVRDIDKLPRQRIIHVDPEPYILQTEDNQTTPGGPMIIIEHPIGQDEHPSQPKGAITKQELMGLETFHPPQVNEYIKGELCIQFWDIARGLLDVQISEGIVTTGIPEMDALNQQYAAFAMDRLVEDYALPPNAIEYRIDLMFLLQMDENLDMEQIAAEYRLLPMVKCVHPNYIPYAANLTKTYPDDTYFDWAPNITQGPKAWTITTGSNSDTLGIIDVQHFNEGHPDLDNNYVGFAGGTDPLGISDWHGTGCASHACAELNNNAGISSSAGGWNTTKGVLWMPYRITSTAENVAGVAWMVTNDACVITQSALYLASPDILEDAFASALASDVLTFAAAGNDNNDVATNMWPAYFDCVIGVGGIDNLGRHWAWDATTGSCYGDWLDITAPADAHWTCNASGYTGGTGGTSWAAPHTAGIAALVVNYRGFRGTVLKEIILRTADANDHLNQNLYSYGAHPYGLTGSGRVSAYEAIMVQDRNVSVNWIAASSGFNPYVNCYDQYLDFDSQDATYGRHSHSLVPYIAVTPRAMVQNRGNTTESFYVTATSTGYSSTKLVSGLAPSEGVIVEFDPFTPGTNGSYTLTVTANLTGDLNANNDDFSVNLTCSYTDTLQCDGGDWNVQYTDAWAAWAISFTPDRPCTLKVIQILLEDDGAGGATSACTLFVWESNSGTPGNRIYSERLTANDLADGLIWWNITLSTPQVINKPVFIGLSTRGGSGSSSTRPCVDRRWDCRRSWFSATGGSNSSMDWGNLNSDLLIRPVVRYVNVYTDDVAAVSIDDPPSFVASNTGQLPKATVTNCGTTTASFNVVCEIDSSGSTIYNQNASVSNLAPNTSSEVIWSTVWTPSWNGTYNMRIYTNWGSDDYRANDTLYADVASNSTVELDAGEGSPYYVFSSDGYFAVRFDPAGACSVLSGVYDLARAGGGTAPGSLYVWDDNSGEPGNVVRGPIAFTGVYDPTWDTVTVTPTPYYTTGSFWLGCYSPGGTWPAGPAVSILADNETPPNTGRSYYGNLPTGPWGLGSHNWLIHATVKYVSSYNTDIGVQSLDAPGSVAKQNFTIIPKATVKNVGRQPMSDFTVRCWFDSAGTIVYTSTRTVTSLLPTMSTQVSFDPRAFVELDRYYKQKVKLIPLFPPFDDNSSNDSLVDSTLCSNLDIISYETGLTAFWSDPTYTYAAQRFTPELPCSLVGTWIALYAPGGWGNECSTYQWNEADYTPPREWPGTEVWKEEWTPSSAGNAAWFRRDIPATYYDMNEDFFIGTWTPTGATEPDMLLDGRCDYARSWYDDDRDTTWWYPLQGDWAIEALVKYMGSASHILRGFVNSTSAFSDDSLNFRSYLAKNPDLTVDETSSGGAITYLGSNTGLWQVDCKYFWPTWTLGDRVFTVVDYETGSGTTGHTGYYAAIIDTLLLETNPQEAPVCNLRQIPVPSWSVIYWWSDYKVVRFIWNKPLTDVGIPDTSYITGYDVYRGTDGVNFAFLRNMSSAEDTVFNDTVYAPYTTYYYATKLLYKGTTDQRSKERATIESRYLSAHTMVSYISVEEGLPEVPKYFSFGIPYPNPFSKHTVINYAVPKTSSVKIRLYDITGRMVASLVDRKLEPGYYSIPIDTKNLASGVYFCRMVTDDFDKVNKLILTK